MPILSRSMTHRLRGRSVRVDPSHDFPAEIYDCMAISIVTNVGLDLATSSWPDGPNAAGCYTVNKNALLSKVSAGADVHGILSPASPITVPVAHRKGAGIPLRAASYCYIYPIGGSLYSELLSVSLASYPWALVLLCGGFGYYDHAGDLVQINAISYAPSNTGVVVVGSPVPAKTRDVILEAMQRQGRMIPFHQPALIEAGFVSFGWVHGGESFEGADLSDEANSNEHGAFVYLRKPPSEDRSEDRGAISQSPIRTIHLDGRTTIPSEKQADELRESGADTFTFYALTPSTGAGFQTMLARVKSDLQNAPQTKQLGDCKLSEAMLSMSHRCVEAMKVADEASQIATLARTTQEPSPPLERLKWQAVRLVALVSYLMLGVLVYAHTEEHDGGTPWTYDEALYFSVVTISTVGYGDISPSKPETKAFTAIYILFGVAIVFGLAGELVTELSDITMEALVKPLVAACRQSRSSAGSDSAGEGGETASAIAHQNVLPAWQFYAYQLVPSFVLGMGLNIFLSAYIYTQTERCSAEAHAGCGHPGGLPFGDAVWHTWITATTVGYGDLDLTTKSSRLWASFHILMSVSWLASLVSQCQSAYQTRQWDLQRAVSYRVQLMPELIDALETPEAKAESRGVNETEFVLGMLIAMGAEVLGEKLAYDVHVKPLITRFRCLDWDHSGELTRDDLAFMIEKANKAQSALNEDEELDPDGQRRGSATAAEAAINVIEAATGLDIDGDGDVGISGHLMQTHQVQRVTVTEAAINVIEAATGLDIDGDGDVGISGHPMQTHQVQKVEDY